MSVYERPYDPLRPVVCIDEMNRQLVEETRIPCGSGQPEKVDSEYVRKGVMDVFMIAEPLAGKRDTVVTEKRTAIDFAHILQRTSDVLYPQSEKTARQKILCKRRQAVVKETGANQRISRAGHNPA